MDIVGCSKLPSDEQKRIVNRLQELVRQSAEFQQSQQSDQLISLPAGDGMALAFFNKLDAAVQCAIEVTNAIQAESLCKIRMGVHTGPVFVMEDINNTRNISGAGINRAERVMSCGDEGHILLSDNVAESLHSLSAWRDKIHAVGECRAKDGWIRVWNLVDGPVGNAALPKKAKRYAQRRQLLMALGGAALALLVAAAVAGSFWMGRNRRASLSTQNEASIAVLPFADMSSDKNQEYFSDGMAEELMNGLAKTPGLRVAGRTSSFQFKNKTEDSRVIGDRLNVATILEGSVRRQGNRARIAVHLIKAEDGFELWSETFDREINDIFAVQQEIAQAVTGELEPKLLGKKAASSAKRTNTEAYNAYLQGQYFYGQRNKENLEKSVDYFQQAIKLDPGYARAWVGLAKSRYAQADAEYTPSENGYQKAREAAERALQLDPNMGEAHAALGWIKMNYDWNWTDADASLQRALVLEPGNVTVIGAAGGLSFVVGRLDEAIARHRRAIEIDPLNSVAHRNIGFYLYYAGKRQEATAALKKALELAPEGAVTHSILSKVYLEQAQPQEALAEAKKEKDPERRLQGLALAYYALGREKESDANLTELIGRFQVEDPFYIAEVYAFRRESDEAFKWLEQAYTRRDSGLTEIKGDPLLKSLESDPRYTALLKKMRLPL